MINEGQTYPEINLEEEIANILAYLRDNGEFSGDAPRLVIIDNDIENARLLNGYTANFDPNSNTITLYTEGRHPSDLMKSYLHELSHCKQNQEGRLQNITTDNITEDDNLAELEREAYEFSGMMFRKYKDSKKIKKLREEYKAYDLNELFEKDPQNIIKEVRKIHEDIKPTGTGEIYEHLMNIVGEIKLNPENSVEINGNSRKGIFTVGDITYKYKIHPIINPYKNEKSFYNVYFHPESNPISEPLSDTTKENYITILNTIYKIILKFANEYKPDYIGISSFDNDLSRNYHAVYNNLSRHNDIPGYKRINSNLEFDNGYGEKGRFIVFQKKKENIEEICHIKDSTDYMGLKQFGHIIGKELGEALQFDSPSYKIFIDLDETLVSFDDGFKTIFGMSTSSYEQKHGRAELIAKIESLDVNFWNNLKWFQNGKALWNYIKKYNPTIITAPSSKSSEIGKRKWVNYNLGSHVPIIFAKADKKANYSGENKILIDDLTSTIYQWIDKGGVGIHYISTFDTINKLKKLGL